MAQSVFFSFQYEPDNWRVQQVMNMGAVSGGSAFTPQDWESVRYKTDAAIEKWIHEQMSYTKAVIVLVGASTADSRWVKHEIIKGWNDHRPLLGVRIHNLLDKDGYASSWGDDPFAAISMTGGGTMADYVEVINPSGGDSKAVYRTIQDNLEDWVNSRAYKSS
ncbi:TIR domain-containing protein [Millisia brevis]|uniref:TIR domain-containing protein n=1 Tax=Millisia brevis TaxID=264148 RepID=UPI00082C94F1|nr:TIR domain-containing protein [Millisia brevis]